MIHKDSDKASRLARVNKNLFLTTLEARPTCTQHNIEPNFSLGGKYGAKLRAPERSWAFLSAIVANVSAWIRRIRASSLFS
jgi:hypothetical protein